MQENTQTFYHILPNGLKIVHRRTDSPVAYTGVMVGAGTRDELPEQNGMAHYIEHCVFKGTARHSARQIIRLVEGIGGEINAYTTKEETTFYAATPVEHVQLTLRLLSELVTCPTFPKRETDKERTVIYDEIESYNDSPSELIYDDFEALVFDGHPLAMPVLGTKKTLRRISQKPETALAWLREQYRPERIVVFCQGNVAPDRIFRLVEQAFSSIDGAPSLEVGSTLARKRFENGSTSPRSAIYKKHTHQTHVMVGQHAYPLGHKNQLALYLLNNIVGGGSLNSRLNLSLREAHGLVYQVESTYMPLSDTGYWATYFACEPEYTEQCMALLRHELDRLTEHPLSESQLRNALRQLRGQMAIAAQNQESSALAMAKSMLYCGSAPTWQETFRKIARTTTSQLLDISREILRPDNLLTLRYE